MHTLLQQELDVNQYLVEEKMSADIRQLTQTVAFVKRILSAPTVGPEDIQRLRGRVEELNERIKEVTLQRDRQEEEQQDKLSIYRHQASSVQKKKAGVGEQLHGLRSVH